MRHILLCAALLSFAGLSIADEVRLKYIRPSKLIGMLAQGEVAASLTSRTAEVRLGSMEGSGNGILPKGVKLVAYDARGILGIEGSAEQIAEVRRYVTLFDIRPAQVSIDMDVSCPVLNYASKTTSTLANNRPWTMKDGTTEVQLSIAPRVNGDGTVTFFFAITRSESVENVVVRLKPDQTAVLKLGKTIEYKSMSNEKGTTWSGPQEVGEHALSDPVSIIKLRFKVLPGEPTENDPPALTAKG